MADPHRRVPPALRMVAGALVVAAALTGCTGDGDAVSGSTAPQPETPSPASSASPSTGAGPSPSLSPEPTSSGPLGPDDMPQPSVLGDGWDWTVIDGDPHDTGFVGNDAATHQRSPVEVAELAVPFGCADRRTAAIVPAFALDATYVNGDRQAVAIRMRFDSVEQARRFVEVRRAALEACAAAAPAYDGRQTVPYVRQVGDVTVSRRTEPAVPGHWGEVAAVTGEADVLLVAVADLSRADALALAEQVGDL